MPRALGRLREMADQRQWLRWHEQYSDPNSSLSRRLRAVQARLNAALVDAPAGPLQLISMCSGQGRDAIGVLANHPRRDDVRARLVELDPDLVADTRAAASHAGLSNVEVVEADASVTSVYECAVPANVVLLCGLFGNISDSDVERTIQALPRLCARSATVIWTRHRRPPDLTPRIREWFTEAGFEEVGFDTEEGTAFGVGTQRFVGSPLDFQSDERLFTFVGDGFDARY
jgi:hypothetical protein